MDQGVMSRLGINIFKQIPIILLLLLAQTFIPAFAQKTTPLTIIYSGNLDGELEPCGCSDEGNFGGIKRRATMLDRLRSENPALITLSAGGLISSEGPNDRLKAEYILKGFNALQYDAIAMQWHDLGYGRDFISHDALPWVASNWQDNNISKQKVITRNIAGKQVQLAYFAWLDPDSSPLREMKGKHAVVSDDRRRVASAIATAKAKGMLTVLSTELPLELVQEVLPLDNVDILFVRANYEVFGEPKMVGHTLVLQPGSRGMRIARVDLTLDSQARITHWNHKVIPMPESVPDAPRMSAWYEEFNNQVKQDYLKRVELKKQFTSGESPFVGAEQCKSCHAAQYKVWENSDHAMAFDALEGVNKSFDPSCIQCHVVGFNKPGGFVDIAMSSHLTSVQCESCHGAGKAHVKSAGKQKVPNADWPREKICGQCHTHPHSPAFNVDSYWPKIAH
jgi:hypothetical protein